MIIFGTGKRIIETGEQKYSCGYCGTEKSVRFEFYISYFHIFWIPLFPYRKQVFSHCLHCRQVLGKKEMLPEQLPTERPKTPWKYFSGIFLVFAFILLIFIAIANEHRETANYLHQPRIGDVYGVKQANGYYTLYLLSDLKGDSLGFRINDYEVTSSSKLSVIRNNHMQDYGDSLFYWSTAALQKLVDSKVIVNIRRD